MIVSEDNLTSRELSSGLDPEPYVCLAHFAHFEHESKSRSFVWLRVVLALHCASAFALFMPTDGEQKFA